MTIHAVSVPTADPLGANLKVQSHLKGNDIKSHKAITHWKNTLNATNFSLYSNERSQTGKPWAKSDPQMCFVGPRWTQLHRHEAPGEPQSPPPLPTFFNHKAGCHGPFIITPCAVPPSLTSITYESVTAGLNEQIALSHGQQRHIYSISTLLTLHVNQTHLNGFTPAGTINVA